MGLFHLTLPGSRHNVAGIESFVELSERKGQYREGTIRCYIYINPSLWGLESAGDNALLRIKIFSVRSA